MMHKIDVDSFDLWRDQHGYSLPFEKWDTFKQRQFNEWCMEHKKHTRIARLFKNSQYKNDDIETAKVREFAETIIKYIDEQKPMALAVYEYEGGVYVESANIGILSERVEEYVHKMYDSYFEKRFHDAIQLIKLNNSKSNPSIFDINTGKIVGTKK